MGRKAGVETIMSAECKNNITVYLAKLCNGAFVYRICDIYGKYITSGTSDNFEFNETLNIFTASRVKAYNVAEIVFDF